MFLRAFGEALAKFRALKRLQRDISKAASMATRDPKLDNFSGTTVSTTLETYTWAHGRKEQSKASAFISINTGKNTKASSLTF